VGIGYGSDLEEVERVVLDSLNQLEGVKEEPNPFFMVDSFGDSAINTTAYFWYDTKNEGLKDMTNLGALAIKTALDKAGIDIPYPIRSVRLEQSNLDT
jgi:small-conductance mechanosensitive channel